MELCSKILLALLPILFYFFPHFLFKKLYNRHVKTAYYQIKSYSLNAYDGILSLEKKIGRVIDFVTFLTIAIITLIAITYNKDESTFFWHDNLWLTNYVFFIFFAGINVFNNLRSKMMLSKAETLCEKIFVLYTGVIVFSFAA